MKKHCCKSIFILAAAVLCLFCVGIAAVTVKPVLTRNALSGSQSSDVHSDPQSSGLLSDPRSSDVSPDSRSHDALPVPQSSDVLPDPQSQHSLPSSAGNAGNDADAQEAERYGGNRAGLLRCIHYNEKEFIRSVNDTSTGSDTLFPLGKNSDASQGTISGGIVPHHLLACRLMAEFFGTLAEDPPETVIVIGPNHKLSGVNEVQISSADWGTPFGILEANSGIAARLAEEFGSARNDDLFENEHSVASLVPYIKYFLPGTKIAPVLLHGSLPFEKAKKLGSVLGEIVSENPGTVVIASIDFSHYLSTPEADEMDLITWNAIKSWDLYSISQMGNDNLDSVPTITTLMTAMDTVSAKNIELAGHNNSSRITQSGYEYTTSYFTMFFRRNAQNSALP